MENFGLVIYLEKAYLFDPNSLSQPSIANIISHEIAHQVYF